MRIVAAILAPALVVANAGAVCAQGTPDFAQVTAVLNAAVADRAFPGCVATVGTSNGELWSGAFGRQDDEDGPVVDSATVYDLASLTKVVGTTSVVMVLVCEGKIAVADPVEKHFKEFVEGAKDSAEREWRRAVTVEHLLTHSSGLPAGAPLYHSAKNYADVLRGALAVPLARAPGERTVYSDLGYILLGEVAASAGGKPLAELERTLILQPLGIASTLRNPPEAMKPRIAPTEADPKDNSRFIHGVVHDENARAGEGLTGHAGLFGTAEDVSRLAVELLLARNGHGKLFSQPLTRQFTTRRDIVKDSSRALGWDTPSGRSSAGSLMAATSFGHTGFTGTSIWIDPTRDLYVILLANRVHPTRANQKIHAVRRAFADAAVRAVDAAARK
jgi:CubicO group peptidase (beta-lactamase class C family)